jgi:hypothetical protein
MDENIPKTPVQLKVKAEHNSFQKKGIAATTFVIETLPNLNFSFGTVEFY